MAGQRRVGIIFLVVFIDLLGFGIIVPQLGVYARLYGASGLQQGLLMASYSLMQFACAPFLGRWSDRVGRKPVLLIALFTSFCGHVLFASARSLAVLFAARLIDGAGGANIATAQAYISDVTPPERRSKMMALVGVAFGVGFVLGPVIGGVAGHWGALHLGAHGGNLAIGAVAVLCSSSTLLLAALRLPESLLPEQRHHAEARVQFIDVAALRTALGQPVLGRLLVIFLVATSGFTVLHAVMPYLIVDLGGWKVQEAADMSAAQASLAKVFGWIGVIAIVVQGGATGALTKRYTEARVLRAGLLLMVVGLVTVPLAGSIRGLVGLITPLSAGNALATVVIPALVTFHAPAGRRGEVLGLMHSLGSIGRIVGPLGGGFLYDWGRAMPFWVGAGLCALAFVLALAVPAAAPAVEEGLELLDVAG